MASTIMLENIRWLNVLLFACDFFLFVNLFQRGLLFDLGISFMRQHTFRLSLRKCQWKAK